MQGKSGYVAGLVALAVCAIVVHAGPSGGTVSGKVTYEGTPAKQKTIDMSKEPSCATQHATPIVTETVVTGPNNALDNVVVYVSAGAPDDAAPSQAAKFDQKGCQYLPHVLAFQVNQTLQIANDDQTSHNIHPLPKINREWNKSQPPGTPPIDEKYDKAEFIPVKCNIHPWMHGNFAVLKNSHYAVTSDGGTFSLANLPPGKYTITAWHESYGDQSQEVTISGNETKPINFVFKAKPY
jgi:Carboxypeptidase regulatory-like domain